MIEVGLLLQPTKNELESKVRSQDVGKCSFVDLLCKQIQIRGTYIQQKVCWNEPIATKEEQMQKGINGEFHIIINYRDEKICENGKEPYLEYESYELFSTWMDSIPSRYENKHVYTDH